MPPVEMRAKFHPLLLVSLMMASCAGTDSIGPVGLHYRTSCFPRDNAKKSSVDPQEIQVKPEDHDLFVKKAGESGLTVLGVSEFELGFSNLHFQIQKQAAHVGASKVIVSWSKKGSAVGSRMSLASQTSSSVGVSVSNSITNALITNRSRYGTSYGSVQSFGTGSTTTFNPGQSTYAREEYVYDLFNYKLTFLGPSY